MIKGSGEKDRRMRAFSGNSYDDYYDHDLREHPLPGRLFVTFVVQLLWVITRLLWPSSCWTTPGAVSSS